MAEVELTPVGILKRYVSDQSALVVTAGRTVAEVLEDLGIPPELVAIVMVNGLQQPKSYRLQEGDKVKLVPLMGGGV